MNEQVLHDIKQGLDTTNMVIGRPRLFISVNTCSTCHSLCA